MTASTPRFSMKKRFIAPVAVMATIPAALALALPAQAANGGNEPCTPSAGTEAVFGDCTPVDHTELQTSPSETPPTWIARPAATTQAIVMQYRRPRARTYPAGTSKSEYDRTGSHESPA